MSLHVDLITKIAATLPTFEIFAEANGKIPIRESDAEFNKKLAEYGIDPVPLARGLYAQVLVAKDTNRDRVLAATINSGVHQHFLAILKWLKYPTAWSVLRAINLRDVRVIPSPKTLAFLLRIINICAKVAPEELVNIVVFRVPEVLDAVLAANQQAGTLTEYLGKIDADGELTDADRKFLAPTIEKYLP